MTQINECRKKTCQIRSHTQRFEASVDDRVGRMKITRGGRKPFEKHEGQHEDSTGAFDAAESYHTHTLPARYSSIEFEAQTMTECIVRPDYKQETVLSIK